jgi:hypothetical protein
MFTCPRRIEQGLHIDDSPLLLSGSNKDEWGPDKTCSYCGSFSQEVLFEAIAEGVKLTPTDKNYKVYVAKPCRGAGKFYFQHLDEAGKDQFLQFLKDGKMNIGVPGYFYVLPFFLCRASGG